MRFGVKSRETIILTPFFYSVLFYSGSWDAEVLSQPALGRTEGTPCRGPWSNTPDKHINTYRLREHVNTT